MSNNQLKILILIGLFAVPFVPLIVSSSLFFPFITGKAFVFRLIVEITFALYLVLALRDSSYRPKFSWILGSIALFLAVMFFADAFAANSYKAFWSNYERMEGYMLLLHLGAFFVVMSSVLKTRELWNRLLATSVFASFVMAVYSFLQLAGKININQGGVRVDGTLGNASYLGIYMVFHIFIAALLLFRFRESWQRLLLGTVALMDLAVLYFTATRGAILGLLGGALLAFFFLVLRSENGSKIRKAAVAGLAGLIVLGGLFFALKNSSFVKSSPVLSRFSSLSFSEIKTQGRYYVWPMAIKGFEEKPILGWGQEGFNYVFNKHYNPKMYGQEPWFDRAHSTPLDWLIAGGALGLLSYASIFLALLYYVFRSHGEILSKNEKAAMLGLIAAYFFNNLFVFDQISSYILFFTILAFFHSHAPQTPFVLWDKAASKLGSMIQSDKSKPIAEALIVIGAALAVYFIIYAPWRQNKELLNVLRLNSQNKVGALEDYSRPLSGYGMGFSESLEHISQTAIRFSGDQNVPAEFKQKIFSVVDGSFQKQLSVSPDDARYRLFYGMFLSRFDKYPEAVAQLQKAAELSPKKQQIYFELVNTLLLEGKTAEALAAAKTAYDVEPSYDEARFLYGMAALAAGQNSISQQVLAGMPESKYIFDDRYINVLLALKRYQSIIDVMKRRVELDPGNVQNRISLTAAYLEAGRRGEAVSTLQDIIRLNPSFKEQGEYYIKEIQAGRNP